MFNKKKKKKKKKKLTITGKYEKRRKGGELQLMLYGSKFQVRENTCYLGLIIEKKR